MTTNSLLYYTTPWHLLGDPDSIGYAFAYGLVALITIWLLEHVSELVLFSITTNGVVLSDAAAHIAFNNSGWIEISRWLLKRPVKNCRLCRRALIAIFLRTFIIAADVFVVFLAVPRAIPVFENQVGSTVLSFEGRKTGPFGNFDMSKQTCRPDPIRFHDFNPTAMRQICLLTTSHLNGVEGPEIVQFSSWEGDILIEQNGTQRMTYIIALSMRLMEMPNVSSLVGEMPASGSLVYDTKPLPNIGRQAADVFLSEMIIHDNGTERCNRVSDSIVSCSGAPLHQLPAQLLFEAVVTKKVNASRTLWISNLPRPPNATLPGYLEVGFISRPRLCIIPALILASCIGFVGWILSGRFGSKHVAVQQWRVMAGFLNTSNFTNPLYLECSSADGNTRETFDGTRASYSTIIEREIRAAIQNGHCSSTLVSPRREAFSAGRSELGNKS